MLCGKVFDRFVAKTPVTVMLRGVLERALAPEPLDQLFAATAERQYTRELLFSSTVDLMAAVACRIYPAVHAAYQDDKARIGVSVRALYDKLAHMEPAMGEELVRHTAAQLKPLLRQMRATLPPLVDGYTTKILDGNHLGASERRLKELRDVAAGPLPGQTLVVLEPEYQLATEVFCGEDGHAQERSLLGRVLERVQAHDLWMADRNFCTTGLLFGLARRQAGFVIRQHAATLQWQRQSKQRRVGRIPEGVVYEQRLWLEDGAGQVLVVRRVTLVLNVPTRDGETEIHVLTNLPAKVRSKRIVPLYRQRWRIEHLFLNLTTILHCELNTLPYPKAALFGFCVALAAGNVLATVKGGTAGGTGDGEGGTRGVGLSPGVGRGGQVSGHDDRVAAGGVAAVGRNDSCRVCRVVAGDRPGRPFGAVPQETPWAEEGASQTHTLCQIQTHRHRTPSGRRTGTEMTPSKAWE